MVDHDMALLDIASNLYQLLAIVNVTDKQVHVRFDRHAHLLIVLVSGLLDTTVDVTWWNGMRLRLTA